MGPYPKRMLRVRRSASRRSSAVGLDGVVRAVAVDGRDRCGWAVRGEGEHGQGLAGFPAADLGAGGELVRADRCAVLGAVLPGNVRRAGEQVRIDGRRVTWCTVQRG